MQFTNSLVIASFVLLLVSFWNRNDIPGNVDFVRAIADEPRQSPTRKQPFDVRYENLEYRVAPQFDYDIVGMIVSYRHHDYKSRMHRLANDHLNMLDVCVVWGDNAGRADLKKIKFWNGIFTCNFETRDQAAWESFNVDQISNNHLISDDVDIRNRVQDIKIGDQIRVQGYLASYTSPNGGERGTSTTRTDTGDGACETIYVERFDIVKSAMSIWRLSMYASLTSLLLGLFLYFRKPFKAR